MKAVVVGAGFGGISSAAYLARAGYEVTVLEKNDWVGGRAKVRHDSGFRFDMGPSWYWMPDQHDLWFRDMGVDRSDYYAIHRVDPSYKVYYGNVGGGTNDVVTIPADRGGARAAFDAIEPGAGAKLDGFIAETKRRYDFAIDNFIYRNFDSIFDFVNGASIGNLGTIRILRSYAGLVRSTFRHPFLRRILEFPVVFLGSSPQRTPAMYTLMNHIDFNLGTWYPENGFGGVVKAMQQVAEKVGAQFRFNAEVVALESSGGRVQSARVRDPEGNHYDVEADVFVATADYHHVESSLLTPDARAHDNRYWQKRRLAPAVLNWYVGFNRRLPFFEHHTFFFDSDWDTHFRAVYEVPEWVDRPLFYLHVPSRTDASCAPEGGETVFILIPTAPGLREDEALRERYFGAVMTRMENLTGESLRDHVVTRHSYSIRDYETDYHAFKGNAFGLGQTLFQTAYFRTPNASKRLKNLYYAGQYTVPGTGTTMSMISGKVVSERILREMG